MHEVRKVQLQEETRKEETHKETLSKKWISKSWVGNFLCCTISWELYFWTYLKESFISFLFLWFKCILFLTYDVSKKKKKKILDIWKVSSLLIGISRLAFIVSYRVIHLSFKITSFRNLQIVMFFFYGKLGDKIIFLCLTFSCKNMLR